MVDIVVGSATHLHYNFKDGFRSGQQLVLGGVSGGSRFAINLFTSDSIALHCNPRQGEGEIVFNTKTGEDWGEEERIDCGFDGGENFEISITCLDSEYVIQVDGGCCHNYSHRLPADDVLYMQLDGDVQLTNLQLRK